MRKFFRFIIFVAIAGVVVFFSLKIMDELAYDPTKDVKDSLYKFYASSSKADLEPIVELVDKYTNDLEKVGEIQEIVSVEVEEWIEYTSNKYLCNSTNANACEVKLKELKILQSKIETIGDVNGENGDRILSSSRYDEHLDTVKAFIKTTENIIDDEDSTSPQTAFEIERTKCNKTNDCENCNKSGLCVCTLKGANGKKETLECYKPSMAK
jgi:hypothetical protein